MNQPREQLPPEISAFLSLRFGRTTGQVVTLEEMANIMGTTPEHVRVIEQRFLREAKKYTES